MRLCDTLPSIFCCAELSWLNSSWVALEPVTDGTLGHLKTHLLERGYVHVLARGYDFGSEKALSGSLAVDNVNNDQNEQVMLTECSLSDILWQNGPAHRSLLSVVAASPCKAQSCGKADFRACVIAATRSSLLSS